MDSNSASDWFNSISNCLSVCLFEPLAIPDSEHRIGSDAD